MLTALLLLVAGDLPHAALHPADSDLYLEFSDARAVLAAYAAAPTVQIVQSEGASRLGVVAKALGADIQALAGSLLPVSDPARPDDPWWPWSDVRRASCSLSGIEDGDSGTDAKPAGWIVVDFAAPEAATQAELALIAMGGSPAQERGEVVLAGATLPVRGFGSPFEFLPQNAWIVNAGSRLIVGLGSASPEEWAARTPSGESGLAPRWSSTQLPPPEGPAGVTVLQILANMDRLPSFAAGDPMWTAATLQLAPFLNAEGRWRIDLRGDRFVTDGNYELRGSAREFLGAFGPAPAQSETLGFVPPEAVGAWIGSVDPAGVEAALGGILAGLLGDASIAEPSEGEAQIADGLRSSAAVSLLPLQSLMSPTPRVLVAVGLADAARFEKGLDAWLARVQGANPDLQIERKPYRKVPTVVIGSSKADAEGGAPGSGSPFGAAMLEPTRVMLAILEDRVILASAPSVARAEIKRLQDKSAGVAHAGASAVAHPADAFEFSTLDWSAFLSSIYDGARGFAPMLAQNLDQPIDVEKLPTGAQLFAPVRPSTSWSRAVGGRIQVHAESSFGPETPLALAALAAVATKSMRMPTPAPAQPTTSTPETTPTPNVADESARTLASLREVRTAIVVYRSQFGRVPAGAADLLKKTDAFPDGFLRTGVLPKDGWDRDLVYAGSADGASYDLYSVGVDGVDQQGSGDDVRLP